MGPTTVGPWHPSCQGSHTHSVRRNASKAHVWATFASSRTTPSICVGPLDMGIGAFLTAQSQPVCRSTSVYGPLEMP
jgi:hypothetical protein